ncbi:PEP-CTERM sorting domain-containing protein [Roseateles toxinivorans]|uniref:Putative secreted protein with PEP-CTERM sorting signal n=1 Tax=Roseateles toxinivorans TaxID=270368 RepID=A0A4R6QRN7_9BURK|nr:PEP-CTERM sorting domain-containing protein [Roseateles toxinivorans]TDP72431.1 putative secreted protein with PEP-CTERM sorting signal [Roseateles toxinivorans]
MRFTPTALGALLLAVSGLTQAAPYVVDAKLNSSSGGTGLSTISLGLGQSFTVSVDAEDLWSAGALPRWSNANGLSGALYATGSDESGQAVGTLIGSNFGLYSQGNLSAAYGSLVGQIGGGDYFVVGTNYAGNAASAGTLKLFYWDSQAGDNTQFITANVNAVPEPESYALLLAGLVAMGFVTSRRNKA